LDPEGRGLRGCFKAWGTRNDVVTQSLYFVSPFLVFLARTRQS
jgi:hypothetical protein